MGEIGGMIQPPLTNDAAVLGESRYIETEVVITKEQIERYKEKTNDQGMPYKRHNWESFQVLPCWVLPLFYNQTAMSFPDMHLLSLLSFSFIKCYFFSYSHIFLRINCGIRTATRYG